MAEGNIFDQFDAESHAKTLEHRGQHPGHSFTYTARMQEAHKKRPKLVEPKKPSPVEAAYRADMAAIAAKYCNANPDWFFFHTGIKVEASMHAISRQHNTRPLA